MPKTYSSKYFLSHLKKIRQTISLVKGYKTVEDLIAEHKKTLELSGINQHRGHEK